MRRLLPVLLAGLLVGGCGGGEPDVLSSPAAAKGKGLRLVKVGDFAEPVYVTSAGRKRTFVVEQAGRIILLRGGKKTVFLDIRDQVTAGGEQGLLSAAFAPDYAESGRFYVYFTDDDGDQRVVEYEAPSRDRADPDSARLVLEMPDSESNHNGGLLKFFGDALYIGTGDGGGGGDRHGRLGNGQNLRSLLGKVLRIDPRPGNAGAYGVPTDNPFYMAKGPRGEIWAYGLRNPWRFDFAANGDFVVADVGQDAFEEVSFVRKPGSARAVNYGWRVFEGDSRYASGEEAPGHVGPVMTFSHDAGNCSITGGEIGRGSAIPALKGRYVFGDFCKGDILTAELRTPKSSPRKTGLRVDSLSSFGEDGRGRVYVTSLNGPVYRLAAK